MIKIGGIEYYNTKDLGEILGADKNYISRQIKSGLLPCSKVGKSYMFSQTDIQNWIENCRCKQVNDSQEELATIETIEEVSKKNEVHIKVIDRDMVLEHTEPCCKEEVTDFLADTTDEEILNSIGYVKYLIECSTDESKDMIREYLSSMVEEKRVTQKCVS